MTDSSHRVLQALVHPLTHYLKFHVLRYNARGVGRSSGWKSLTGLQEGDDLRELVQYALKRLGDVRQVVFIVRVPPSPLSPHIITCTTFRASLSPLSPLQVHYGPPKHARTG